MNTQDDTPEEIQKVLAIRILDRFDQIEGGHWIWNGTVNSVGNPVIGISRGPGRKGTKTFQVRRVVYETTIRELIDNEVVYLGCEESKCIAPLHLMALTPADLYRLAPHLVRRGPRWEIRK